MAGTGGAGQRFVTADGETLRPDVFLGGKLKIVQPSRGYRAGFDAVLLSASVPVTPGKSVRLLDAGAGVGTVGLAFARRVPHARVTLVERERELADMASWNITGNELSDRVSMVCADVTASGSQLLGEGLAPESYDIVVANPPYMVDAASQRPSDPLKAMSHQMKEGELELWMRFAARMLAAKGEVFVIHRTAALPELLAAMSRRFGAISVVPVHSREAEPAKRIIISGRKGSREGMRVLPGLVVHEGPDNAFRAEMKAVSSEGAGLDIF